MKNNVFKILSILLTVVVIGLVVFVVIEKDDEGNVEVSSKNSEVVGASGVSNSGYYNQLGTYMSELTSFLKETYEIVQNQQVNSSNESELLSITNDFIIFSESFKVSPITEADKIMNNEFLDLKYDAEMNAEYALKYIHKKDDVSRSFHKDFYNNIKIHMSTLSSIEAKYY